MASHTTTVQLQTPIDSRYNRIRHLVKFTNLKLFMSALCHIDSLSLPHQFSRLLYSAYQHISATP